LYGYEFAPRSEEVVYLVNSVGGWLLVLITCSSREEAYKIAKHLVEKKLASCVNIVDNIHSIYWWMGNVEESDEALLITKSRSDKFEAIVEEVRKLHSYQIPEIIGLPIMIGFEKYIKWLNESIS